MFYYYNINAIILTITLYIIIPIICAALCKLSQKSKITFVIILTIEYLAFYISLAALYVTRDYYENHQYTAGQITSGVAQIMLITYGISWILFRKGKKDRYMPLVFLIIGHFFAEHILFINTSLLQYLSFIGIIYLLISYFVILIRKIRENPALSVKDNKEINTENDKKTNEETDKKITIKTLKTTKRSSPKSKKTQKSPKKSLPK